MPDDQAQATDGGRHPVRDGARQQAGAGVGLAGSAAGRAARGARRQRG